MFTLSILFKLTFGILSAVGITFVLATFYNNNYNNITIKKKKVILDHNIFF